MMLSDMLGEKSVWESFYSYKTSLVSHGARINDLRKFIDEERYMPVYERIKSGETFPLPKKSVLNKMSSQKRRTIYMYPFDENMVLKLLTYLVLRKYDDTFAPCLYSFRPKRNAKDAIKYLLSRRGIDNMYAYKADVSNYFNSIPVERLLPMVKAAFADDTELCDFLCGLLSEPYVTDGGERVREQKGIMAGTPIASFYANLYLNELDRSFFDEKVLYMRYSDDIIVFAEDEDTVREYAKRIRDHINAMGLHINPDKESFFTPDEGFTFLGFRYRKGVCDIADATVDKLKGKMRRKARALQRWYRRNGADGESGAKAFIRIFNKKLLESPEDNELSWSYWFFSVINTDESLRTIDRYAQDCIRFLWSGKRTKSRFNVRYEDMKKIGYRSLVNAYYSSEKED